MRRPGRTTPARRSTRTAACRPPEPTHDRRRRALLSEPRRQAWIRARTREVAICQQAPFQTRPRPAHPIDATGTVCTIRCSMSFERFVEDSRDMSPTGWGAERRRLRSGRTSDHAPMRTRQRGGFSASELSRAAAVPSSDVCHSGARSGAEERRLPGCGWMNPSVASEAERASSSPSSISAVRRTLVRSIPRIAVQSWPGLQEHPGPCTGLRFSEKILFVRRFIKHDLVVVEAPG